MLIKRRDLDRIAAGQITLAFRRWKRPTVKQGGRLRTVIGELAIDDVQRIRQADITEADARRAGFADRAELLKELSSRREGQVYRIAVRLAGPDTRVQLRKQDKLSVEERTSLLKRLERLDRASRHGPWVAETLQLIARRPETLASELAAELSRDKASFKTDVRKLKNLGLTESLRIGYRLSPRGRAILKVLGR